MYTEEPRPLEELVPQRPYTSRSSHSFHGGSIINFTKDGAGIFLWHVLLFEEAFVPEAWLAEAAVPPGSTGQKIQIRLNWPGCKGLSESINILDHKGDPQPVSKFKLLRRVAVAIDKMMNTNTRLPGQNDGPWRIGPDGVRFYQIRLHSLRQVAKASWQPVLFWCGRPLEGVDDAPGV
ncbi:hypothetical protein PsYK624_091760 [Phanerochaete sordida]|uniref:Uncharacterized protein n=1 Tax=Phanerochaete sordida TaxID=48140 RepID=A0A9P3GE06_9APHY|nr:hypothetical protein PsYK624_091760 [Phanerochaete sordida]